MDFEKELARLVASNKIGFIKALRKASSEVASESPFGTALDLKTTKDIADKLVEPVINEAKELLSGAMKAARTAGVPYTTVQRLAWDSGY